MSLSLIVCSEIQDSECLNSFSPLFYTFIQGYSFCKQKSVLAQIGRYFGLKTSPLGKVIALEVFVDQESNQKYIQKNCTEITLMLSLCLSLLDKIKSDRKFVETLYFSENEEVHESVIRDYLLGEQILIDLENLIWSIECYRGKGATKIFLGLNG
jgi:hypothetical protein